MTKTENTEISHLNKKIKADDTHSLESILNEFELVKVLNENAAKKLIIIQAIKKTLIHKNGQENGNGNLEIKNEESINRNAVIIFEKPHFGLEETKSYLEMNNQIEINIDNDIYKKLSLFPSKPFNNVQVQLIYPATDAHIKKYTAEEMLFLTETYQDWLNITSKYFNESSFDLQWVYNILEHKTETERIVFEDPDPENGFILLPDIKWDGKTVESLYLIAIIHQKEIKSLRDLNKNHIKLLENIREKSFLQIDKKYDLKKSFLRAYLHYQPSFHHLHVHFTHIKLESMSIPERNHSLTQVIENLKIDSDFYRKTAIEYAVKKNDPIYNLYRDRFE